MKKLPYLRSGLLSAAGLAFLAWGVFLSRSGGLGQGWPTATGVIVLSRCEETGGEHFSKVIFEYTVDGVRYCSDMVDYTRGIAESEKEARQKAQKYPYGKKVKVYYNPQNPGMAVLEPGESGRMLAPIFLGIACLFAGLTVILWNAFLKGKILVIEE
ncbi:MAG: DUF3592 domain-containing protein [Bacillota bacterium]